MNLKKVAASAICVLTALGFNATDAEATTNSVDAFKGPIRKWIAKAADFDFFNCSELTQEINDLLEEKKSASLSIANIDDDDVDLLPTAGAMSMQEDDEDACFILFNSSDAFAFDVVKELEAIDSVEEDGVVTLVENPVSWGLDRLDQARLPLNNDFTHGYTGRGQSVYVIDTGIYVDHVDFGGRAKEGADFVNERVNGDGNGHGTHCAGTVAGSTAGIASEATVYGVKVLSSTGSGSSSGVIRGIQWATKHAGKKTSVLSISLGGGYSSSMNAAVKQASDAGHIVVVAAGNSDTDACRFSPASQGGIARDTYGVISVGATTNKDERAYYSNYGACVDIFAPGSAIISLSNRSPTRFRSSSGTSMATPHVAGVAAILLEKHNGDKQAAMDDLFALSISKIIDGIPKNTVDKFLQVPLATGPPTPPTIKPTAYPTVEPATLCRAGFPSVCKVFMHSTFGPPLEDLGFLERPLAYIDAEFCDGKLPDAVKSIADKIVIVKRGSCTFFKKVKHAEKLGAAAVLIENYEMTSIFEPKYYGSDTTKLHSAMIGYAHGQLMKRWEGLAWGSPSLACAQYSSKKECSSSAFKCTWNRSQKACF